MQSSEKLRPLLRRPESSSIEIADFSFGKPASHKSFSLRGMPKQAPIPHPQMDTTQPSNDQTGNKDPHRPVDQENTISNSGRLRKEDNPTTQDPARQSVLHQPASQISIAAASTKELSIGNANAKASFGLDQVNIIARSSEPTGANPPRQSIGPTGKGSGPARDRADETERTSEVESASLELPPMKQPRRDREQIAETRISRMPLKPVNSQIQASKRHRALEKGYDAKHQAAHVSKHDTKLSEDDLFELLIKRMKEREESEHAAMLIQQQVENENLGLKEENLALQNRVKKCQGQLTKASSESRAQRAQLDKWKEKIILFKGVLNELGREYGTAKEHAKELKEATVSLDREKGEIQEDLVDMKLQLLNYGERLQGQREKLWESEATIGRLKEALNHSERRGELLKTQVSNEKKRIITLEAYIQNASQSQAQCLALVRSDQRKMTDKFDSACELFSTLCTNSQEAILSKLGPTLEQCVDSVQMLKNQYSTESMNMQDSTRAVEEANSRLNSLAGQVTNDMNRGAEMNTQIFQELKAALQAIETHFGPSAAIFKQLSNSENYYGELDRRLQAVEPMLGTLGDSVKALEITETDLVRGLEVFGQKLSEARIPAGNPVLETEISNKFAENTQLQLQLQEKSMEMESLRMQLAKTTSECQNLRHTLTETVTNEQASKSQIARLEIEKTALRGEHELLERRIREELGIASTKLQDQMKARLEEQAWNHETEKTYLKKDCTRLLGQLETTQSALIETEKTAERQQIEQASLLLESNKRVEKLNDSCSKYIAEAKANEAESQLSKRCEVDLRMENNTLLEQLQQMKDKTIELESSLAQKTESEMLKVKAAQQAEAKASLFEKETAKATEELKTLNESLTMLRSRSSALEKVGEEADAEIVSLLRRAQEAESWQATIREGFAKVMAVQPDEPFEQTWQKLEEILQSSLAEAPIPCNVSCIEPRVTDNGETTGYPDLPLSQWDGKEDHIDQTRPSEKQVGQSVENLSPRAGGSLKALKHGDRVASLPKYSSHVSHIVLFASIHDKLSREESLSLLNDPAELEMLFMSTPDLQGGPVQSDPVKETQEDQKLPIKSQAISCEPKSSNPVQKQLSRAQDNERERVSSAVESFDSEAVERSTKSELPKTKRKVVSFEGTHVFTETEVGRARRMSDATDNSSGRESESKPLKKTHKRTYSRLRQSVAQEESSIETTTNVQIASKTLEGRAQNNPTNKAEHSSNTNLRPTKRPRDAAHGPGRRLSPKGLASGSSRSNAVNQDNTLRSRGKRRTRGDRYDRRFSQDAG